MVRFVDGRLQSQKSSSLSTLSATSVHVTRKWHQWSDKIFEPHHQNNKIKIIIIIIIFNKLKLQTAINGPLQSTHVRACCCQGVPRTRPNCPITAYASLNCLCFRQCRKGLNVISCVHVVLWLWLCIGLCVQGWTLIKLVKFGPDRNEEL